MYYNDQYKATQTSLSISSVENLHYFKGNSGQLHCHNLHLNLQKMQINAFGTSMKVKTIKLCENFEQINIKFVTPNELRPNLLQSI